MERKNKFMYVMAVALCLIGLSGCDGEKSLQMANELQFSMSDISDLIISYDEEKVTFSESDSDEMVIREYMTANKKSYYAKAAQRDNRIKISGGGKPFWGDSYKANNSGKLDVTYWEMADGVYLFNKNEDMHLTIPKDLAFEVLATSKNGSVSTNFQESITVDGRTTKGTVGSQPAVVVEVETKNGNIEVIQ